MEINNFTLFGMEGDYPFQWTNLIFLLIPVIKAAVDVFLFQKEGIPVNHKESLMYSLGFGLMLSLIDWQVSDVQYLGQSMVLGVSYFFLWFDYIRNIFAGEKITYIDSNPDSDKAEDSKWDVNIYSRLGILGTIFVKFWVALFGIAIYYFLSYV